MASDKLTLIKKIIEQKLSSLDFDKEIEKYQSLNIDLGIHFFS